jgi:hypothetical protein
VYPFVKGGWAIVKDTGTLEELEREWGMVMGEEGCTKGQEERDRD